MRPPKRQTKYRLPEIPGRRFVIILQLRHPQAMEIAVGIDCHGLVILQDEGHLRGLARIQVLPLAAPLGLSDKGTVLLS